MFALGELYSRDGKLAVIRQVARRPALNSVVIDSDDLIFAAALDTALPTLNIIIEQFRAAYAGGWDLRNAYLEGRRDYDRAWLRMKALKDIWWAQTQGDMQFILAGPPNRVGGAAAE
jgi:hypothetical protein